MLGRHRTAVRGDEPAAWGDSARGLHSDPHRGVGEVPVWYHL